MAVIDYDGDWEYDAIYIADRNGVDFQVIEVGDAIDNAVRSYLRRKYPRAYRTTHRADVRDPAIEVSDIRLTRDTLRLKVWENVSYSRNDLSVRHFHESVNVHVALRHGRHGLSARVSSITPLPD